MSFVMTLGMVIGPGGLTAAALDATVDLSSLTANYTITESGSYTFSGKMATGKLIVVNPNISGDVNITLNGVKIGDPIDQMESKYASALEIGYGTTVNLTVTGQNTMIGGNAPGIRVLAGAALNIDGDGYLTASCVASSLDGSAAGIGGAKGDACGTITINGGTLIHAIGYRNSAGIGSGYEGSGGSITINGGNVSASAGAVGGGAAIGSGREATGNCSITINGGNVQASSINASAAIGNGYGSTGAAVTITGGSVITESAGTGAAIGNGRGIDNCQSNCTVLISGGTVTAKGSATSAGIGGGARGNGCDVTITGGTVTASGSMGIGPGENGTPAGFCIVTGGSVKLAAHAAVCCDAANTPAYPVSVTVPGITAATAVSYSVNGGSAVSCTTDAAGKLYLWLPAQANATVSVNVSGKTYAFIGEVTSSGTNTLAAVITVGTGGNFGTLTDALAAASDGCTIRLLNDIEQSTAYMVTADKTITIDGGGFALTGVTTQTTYPIPLYLHGTGTVILKNLYLFGGPSTLDNEGLVVSGHVSVRGDHVYVESGSAETSCGLFNDGSGTVDVTQAVSKDGSIKNYGVMNTGSGTVNVLSAVGSDPTGSDPTESGIGVLNKGTGTVNVLSAIGSTEGVRNESTGTVNAKSAEGTSGNAVDNLGGGTVNVTQAYCESGNGVSNSGGTVNAGTVIKGSIQGTINTGDATASLALKKGSGVDCILDSVTVAAAGDTTVGSLPSVYKNGGYSNLWYTDAAKLTPASSTVTAGTTLYSSYYTPDKISTAAISGVTIPVSGKTPVSSIADTAQYTASISWLPNDAVFAANTAYTATITIAPKNGYTLAGVGANFFTVSGASATNAVDTGIVTAVFPKTASSGITGGGSVPSSGGSSSNTPSTPASGSTGTTATAKTGTDGKAAASVTQSQLSDALDKAKAAAGANGKPDVKIQIDGASGASSVGTTLPQASVQALVSGNAGALTISGPTGALTFDAAALKTISDSAGGDVTVTVSKVDTSTLSDTAKQAVGSHPVYEFSVTSDGKTISQFGGSVTVSVPYTPVAGEDTNAIVIYYIAADGKLTMVPDARYDAATGTVVFTTTHFSTYAVGYNKMNFTDVSNTAWYSNAVTFLAARGITSGTTATSFSPDASLTRGQFVTMLLRAYSISPDANPTDNFADAGSTYYTNYLAAAKRMGITSGIGDNMFAPDRGITRQEMFTLLYSALKATGNLQQGKSGKTLADFSDASEIASWAKDAMTLLVETGTVSGSGDKLSPTSATTRAEMAQVLYNLVSSNTQK